MTSFHRPAWWRQTPSSSCSRMPTAPGTGRATVPPGIPEWPSWCANDNAKLIAPTWAEPDSSVLARGEPGSRRRRGGFATEGRCEIIGTRRGRSGCDRDYRDEKCAQSGRRSGPKSIRATFRIAVTELKCLGKFCEKKEAPAEIRGKLQNSAVSSVRNPALPELCYPSLLGGGSPRRNNPLQNR